MSFWDTMLATFKEQMIEAGVPEAVARERATKAVLVITQTHHREEVLVTLRPYAVRAALDAQMYEMAAVHGIEGTAGRFQVVERTVERAVERHRMRNRKTA
jgi:hypothetical protein